MAPVKVITLSRQLASGGDVLAEALSARLGWRCLGRDIIDAAARASGAGEAALADIDELNLLGIRPPKTAKQAYRQAMEAIIRDAAAQGQAIIVGRGGQVILQQEASALHLKVIAPIECRLRYLMAREHLDEEAAINRIVASDRARANYLRRQYGVQWLDPQLYHMMLNVDPEDLSWAQEVILRAIEVRV